MRETTFANAVIEEVIEPETIVCDCGCEALKYIAKYCAGLIEFLDDVRVELGSNTVERTNRLIALNRKNALFAEHDAGASKWAMLASLIETCKLNAVDPHA